MPGWLKIAVAVDVVSWLAASFKVAALLTLVLGVLYAGSLWEPWRDCRRCGGSNKRSWWSWLTGGTFREGCGSRWCYGGKRLRWGIRFLTPRRAKALTGR